MTRFEPDNCLALCYGCHSKVDANAEIKRDLFIKAYGQKRYDELRVMSKKPYKGIKKDLNTIADGFKFLFKAQVELDKCIDIGIL